MSRHPARVRLTACAGALAATAAVGVLLAPAASAAPERGTLLPQNASDSDAPYRTTGVLPFGRKL